MTGINVLYTINAPLKQGENQRTFKGMLAFAEISLSPNSVKQCRVATWLSLSPRRQQQRRDYEYITIHHWQL
jgi:hypothetical protein